MFRACASLLCLSLAAATSEVSISQFAVPGEVKAGQNVELQCQYKLQGPETPLFYVKWWWTPLNSTEPPHQIYQRILHNDPQVAREGINIKGNDTIELENLQPSDSGTYECEVSNMDEARRKQELIVYTQGSGPLLEVSRVTNGSDEEVVVTCQAHGAAPQPELELTVDGNVIPPEEVTLSDMSNNGTYSIEMHAAVDALDAGAEVRCELFYTSNITHEAYIATETYLGDGERQATQTIADLPESTPETDAATTVADGSASLRHFPWLLLLLTSALAHVLATH